MLSISNLSKYYGAQTLFVGASYQFQEGNRYGIVGANGSGKSTLLKILAGQEEASEGEVDIAKRLRVGVLKQDHFAYEDSIILDVVLMGIPELYEAMREKEVILERSHIEFDADRYSELEDIVLAHDGYSIEARAGEILEGLGVATALHHEPMSILSGGFKLRVLLAQTLASNPDVLFLDEPTNHLDIVSIAWLEGFLQSFRGCVLIVSHDRRFLDAVCTHIVDVDYEQVNFYKGNYEDFERQKAEHRDRMESEIDKREREIEKHKQFIERFKAKASKARQAKSKKKQLDRIEIEKLPQSSRQHPRIRIPQTRPSGKEVLVLENIHKSYDDKRVLNSVSLSIYRGERVAIIGPNGIGKSTLLKIMMGHLEPDQGTVSWGYETHPGYFSQDHREVHEAHGQTLQEWFWSQCPDRSIGEVRSRLADVLFTKDEVEKPLEALSGGEATRLIFARLAVKEPNVLVLDEPTNHLDLEGIEALADGLLAYEGTLLFVSHDRWFVSKLANRVIELRPDGFVDFRGTYADYIDHGQDHLDHDAVLQAARS